MCLFIEGGGGGKDEDKVFVTSSAALQMTLNTVVTKRQVIKPTKTTQKNRISIHEEQVEEIRGILATFRLTTLSSILLSRSTKIQI